MNGLVRGVGANPWYNILARDVTIRSITAGYYSLNEFILSAMNSKLNVLFFYITTDIVSCYYIENECRITTW